MTTEKIKALLQRYFDGETSLEEEEILRGYFSNAIVDEQFIKYKPLFNFITNEKTIVISDKLNNDIKTIKAINSEKQLPKMSIVRRDNWWKIAAAIAFLMVGSWAVMQQFKAVETLKIAHKGAKIIVLDENTDPEVALAEVEKALMKVSKKMKKGTDETAESLEKVKSATKIIRN